MNFTNSLNVKELTDDELESQLDELRKLVPKTIITKKHKTKSKSKSKSQKINITQAQLTQLIIKLKQEQESEQKP